MDPFEAADYILDEARDSGELPPRKSWTTFHDPAVATCARCGTKRPSVEMARIWRSMKHTRDNDDELYYLVCHGDDDPRPTCYDRLIGTR